MSSKKTKQGYKLVKWYFGKEIQIPEEWEIKSTSEILKITMGQSPSSKSYNEACEGLPFYQGVTDFGATYPNPTVWCTEPKKIAKENSILFSVRAPVGEINLTKTKCCLGRGVAALNPLENNLWYCYYLLNKNKKNFLIYSSGTTYDAINRNEIDNVKLSCTTNTHEQQKIASILSRVDALIESTQKIIDQTKSVKKGLMQKLLTKGIGHKKFKKVKFGLRFIVKEIPEEWSVKRIDIVCKSIVSGRNKPKNFDGDIPWITIEDLDNFFIKKSKLNLQVSKIEIKQSGGKIIPKNSVIMSCVGEFGIIGINENEVVLNQQLHAFQCLNYITPYFLALFLSTMKNYMDSVSTMTTISYLNKNNCGSILIVIPPLSEQQQISSIISTIDSQIQSQTQYKEKLERLKKSLMQKLLTGEVRVIV